MSAAVVARRVAATPVRSVRATWDKIVDVLAADTAARTELAKAVGVACTAISSEATKEGAIVVWGGGSRVRVYCVFDEDAIIGDDVSESVLVTSPCKGDWKMSIPCLAEDVAWCSAALASVSTRISARAHDEDVQAGEEASAAKVSSPAINLNEFFKS
jgi:hypothetical protein